MCSLSFSKLGAKIGLMSRVLSNEEVLNINAHALAGSSSHLAQLSHSQQAYAVLPSGVLWCLLIFLHWLSYDQGHHQRVKS